LPRSNDERDRPRLCVGGRVVDACGFARVRTRARVACTLRCMGKMFWGGALLLGCAVLGCESDVRRVQGEGGGGASPGPTSTSASVGGAGQGGASEGGAPPSPPVVGCEQLAWAGEALVLPGVKSPREIALAHLEGGRVGVVYRDRDGFDDVIDSLVLDGAFDTWPPTASAAVRHFAVDLLANGRGPFSARADGLFALGWQAAGVYRFGQEGAVATPSSVPGEGVSVWLEPEGSGALLARVATESPIRLSRVANAEALTGEQLFAEFQPSDPCGALHVASDGATTLLSFGSFYACQQLSSDAHLQVFRAVEGGGVAESLSASMSVFPRKQRLLTRPGGYYFAAIEEVGRFEIHRLDSQGAAVAPPILDADESGLHPQDFATWRDGHALLSRGQSPAGPVVSLVVTDGVGRTSAPPLGVDFSSSASEAPMLSGGEGERSVLVAAQIIGGVAIARADCVPAE